MRVHPVLDCRTSVLVTTVFVNGVVTAGPANSTPYQTVFSVGYQQTPKDWPVADGQRKIRRQPRPAALSPRSSRDLERAF